MVVDDLNFVGVATRPNEADSPLVIDPYAVLAAAPPFQALQTVRWWHAKIGQVTSVV
jgi:hypothetical protein